MIYQLYYREAQRPRLYNSDPYVPLGLEPDLNNLITHDAPELRLGAMRHALCEYGGIIHVHRVQERRKDPWIGFTSWRQSDKGIPQISRREIELALSEADVASWGRLDTAAGLVSTVRDLPTFVRVFDAVGVLPPDDWYLQTTGTFGNYWAMRWEDFDRYMEWSRPFLDWIVRNFETNMALHSRGPMAEPFVGEFFERLFDIWRLRTKKGVHYLHHIMPLTGVPRSHDFIGLDL